MARWHRTSGLVALLLATSTPALAYDSDGDGVQDASDVFPCDGARASASYAPARGVFGSLAFEDEWPNDYADLDFNDLVVAWNYAYHHAADGRVVRVRAVFEVLAFGATYEHALGLHLPAPASAVASVTRTVGGVTTPLTASSADAELTVSLVDDVRALFGGPSGPVNAVPGDAVLPSTPIVIEVVFAQPVTMSAASAPHDVYLSLLGKVGHEIHRPEFAGTAQMDATLFGAGIDGSGANRKFVDTAGMPYVLAFPSLVPYPQEGVDIAMLYPDVVPFAASGGQSNPDFFSSTVDAAYAFSGAPTPTFVPGPAIDTACVPTGGPSCLAILQSGQSTGSGLYEIDFDGSGPQAPFEAYCDMTTDGGGWTLVEVIKNNYHTNGGAVNVAALTGRATHAKRSDADIRTLATNGSLQAMVKHPSTIYIQRYSASEWSSFSSTGWTNVTWDSLRSDGVWVNSTCNGHFNNRGFSTYSDRNGRACPVVFGGGARYMTTWHTYNYAGGVGGAYEVYVR